MKIQTLIVIVSLFPIQSFAAGERPIVSFSRTVKDRECPLYQTIDVSEQGRAVMYSSGLGGDCPKKGGTFAVDLKKDEHLRLIQNIRMAIAEQKQKLADKKGQDQNDGGASSTFEIEDKDKFDRAKLVEFGNKWKAAEEQLTEIKLKMAAVSSVELLAKKGKSELVVTFKYQGKEPFEVLLPDVAGQAFRTDKATLEYKTPPKNQRVILTKKNAEYSLRFKLPEAGSKIFYSNAKISPVVDAANQLGVGPEPLNLCTSY